MSSQPLPHVPKGHKEEIESLESNSSLRSLLDAESQDASPSESFFGDAGEALYVHARLAESPGPDRCSRDSSKASTGIRERAESPDQVDVIALVTGDEAEIAGERSRNVSADAAAGSQGTSLARLHNHGGGESGAEEEPAESAQPDGRVMEPSEAPLTAEAMETPADAAVVAEAELEPGRSRVMDTPSPLTNVPRLPSKLEEEMESFIARHKTGTPTRDTPQEDDRRMEVYPVEARGRAATLPTSPKRPDMTYFLTTQEERWALAALSSEVSIELEAAAPRSPRKRRPGDRHHDEIKAYCSCLQEERIFRESQVQSGGSSLSGAARGVPETPGDGAMAEAAEGEEEQSISTPRAPAKPYPRARGRRPLRSRQLRQRQGSWEGGGGCAADVEVPAWNPLRSSQLLATEDRKVLTLRSSDLDVEEEQHGRLETPEGTPVRPSPPGTSSSTGRSSAGSNLTPRPSGFAGASPRRRLHSHTRKVLKFPIKEEAHLSPEQAAAKAGDRRKSLVTDLWSLSLRKNTDEHVFQKDLSWHMSSTLDTIRSLLQSATESPVQEVKPAPCSPEWMIQNSAPMRLPSSLRGRLPVAYLQRKVSSAKLKEEATPSFSTLPAEGPEDAAEEEKPVEKPTPELLPEAAPEELLAAPVVNLPKRQQHRIQWLPPVRQLPLPKPLPKKSVPRKSLENGPSAELAAPPEEASLQQEAVVA